MANDTGRHPTPARRRSRRLASAFVLATCALSLAAIPTATARRDRTSPPAASAPPAGASAQTAPAQSSAPAASAPRPQARRRANAESPHSPGTGGSTGTATAPVTSGATPEARHDGSHGERHAAGEGHEAGEHHAAGERRDAAGQRGRRGERARQGSGQTQPSSAQAEEGPEALYSAAPAPGLASKARKHGRGHHREGETARSHEPGKRSKAKSSQPPAESGGAPGSATVATTASTGATASASAPSPSVAAASATASPAQVTGAPQSALDGRPTHIVRRAARAPHPAARRRAGSGTLAYAAAAPAAATSTRTALAAHPRAARTGARRSSARTRPSPLVTTITRIVDVVPTAMRLLIAALLALALALAVRSRVAAVRARRLERQRGELLEDVGLLQAALLPVPPARLGPVGTSAAYRPATGPGAGGDFYDVFALEDGQLAVIVGDVSGHGRQALPHTALVRFTLRAYLEAGLSPRDAIQTAGAVLERQLGGVFATVVVATYQPRERVLVYACAGHPPPVVLGGGPDANAVAPVTICTPPPIGVGMRTGTRQTAVSIPGRSQICFYTDGVTEARVGSELFGPGRLLDTLVELGPRASAAAVLERVAEQADARPDDMAACLLGVEGEDAAPTILVEELELDRDEASSERTARFLLACGVERAEVAAVIHDASLAAGRAGTVVLELRRGAAAPRVTLRREHLAYLHARRADVGAAL
jgi:serine phosphatase RsbU (regulator of sigma subunit)